MGIVQRKDLGRPELVYGRRCKHVEIPHELYVCEAELLTGLYLERSTKRGRAEPDGIAQKEGFTFYLEVDHSAKMNRRQMTAKFHRYAQKPAAREFLLVIAHGAERMRRIADWAVAVESMALFTTFDRLRAGQGWVDRKGEVVQV